ncbi:cytochrome c oxidase assembly protein [Motilibacter deserti]|uniref:Bifunctional copper resistance protein CopD/cytochrome c oxidase assembly protein n=1 Tax=Motilibacter deserti TaxID=2714956 RepID=A0ABX0GPM9_9ACTN|nr:cytochrome c oxidase assembly protein [Motilibacter deserti]NHC12793.1 bifunctional copper resistance protein CopD/cytochrome c oxidase assembly protein [Motilibacter deserti]
MSSTSTTAPVAPAPERADPRRTRRPWGPPAAAVAYLVLLVTLVVGGGRPEKPAAGLPDAGPVTGWGLPLARLLADGAAVATVGLLLAGAVLLANREGQLRGSAFLGVRLAGTAAAAWASAALVQTLLTLSDVFGQPPLEALSGSALHEFLTVLPQGRALVVQVALACLVAVLARFTTSVRGALLVLALAVGAVTPPLLTGHAAGAGNHMLAVSSLVVHVVAAVLWAGGLAALLWVWRRTTTGAPLVLAVPRYSRIAIWAAVAVGASGVVSAWLRLGSVEAVLSSQYGGLVLWKAAGFALLVAFGARMRLAVLPRLADSRDAFARLAAVEVLVMAGLVGLAVALARTPTPIPTDTAPATASLLRSILGFDPPPAPTPLRYLTEYQVDGFFLTFVILAGALYAVGVRTMHRRGDGWPVGRTVSWYAGLAVVLYCTCGGLAAYSHLLFSAHMMSHMVLSMVAPIFLVLGAPVTLALRTLPNGRTPEERGPRQALLAALHSRPVSFFTHPLVAGGIFVGSLFALYFTPLFGYLMGNHALGHTLMAAHFLAAGSLFFYVLVGIDPSPRKLPYLARIGVLFAAMPFHAFFSIAVMSTTSLLAADYYEELGDPYGRGLLDDQHLGGGLGWGLGEVPIAIVLIAVFVAWTRADEREARRTDRAADRASARGEEDELAAYNAWLRQMNERGKR